MQMDSRADGWNQIRAGLALIEWSNLASWDKNTGKLSASAQPAFEAVAVKRHQQFGRVISWIVFAVGCEYVLKGVCLVRGLLQPKLKKVLRPPHPDDDLANWIHQALGNSDSVREEVSITGQLKQLPLDKLVSGLPERDLAMAAFELLRESIRNRDAHQYVRDVRAAHFKAVPRLLVPALNAVLGSLSPNEVLSELSAA